MSDILAARAQMAVSLGFHIIFAVLGIGMPLLMAIAEGLWLRTREPGYVDLARRWARGTALLFAVGAVSGTVLSFELGLLWPRFMELAGGVIGMPFSLEGFAFFTEAIFLGIYLYGWDRISPGAHWLAGLLVAASGMASGVFVVTANAWMNAPTGFRIADGRVADVDPIAAMLNPASLNQVVHMTLAAYVATGFGVAAVHAFFLLRDRSNAFHRRAFAIALAVATVAILLEIVSGDATAKMVARHQPAKFAAMEGHYRTEPGAALLIGGLPDDAAMRTPWALRVPRLLSFLAHGELGATVTGLADIPRDEWPPTAIVHLAFDVMVGLGVALLALTAWAGWLAWRRRGLPDDPRFLRACVAAGPLGFLAVEAGWTVTEVGRQPWIIWKIMRTSEAVTSMPGLAVPLVLFTGVFLVLAAVVLFLLRRQFLETDPARGAAAAPGDR
ncbi:MAG: cytochrome BD ubiquinol oxidase subunit I [Candidatus Rokubacteria bacterium RIFCSPLOWO2_02_FULL_72_37]|nr:MAG: cytochrome BD ubiquinol oxidase subunit I [Candidatus Rokubacteria bacterium RIFCSPLOWO2_02_FULL_72_37]